MAQCMIDLKSVWRWMWVWDSVGLRVCGQVHGFRVRVRSDGLRVHSGFVEHLLRATLGEMVL